ncbi:hypothetical protein U1Q18_043227, partial [Sarracenia purpurea var. burkii]
GSLPLHHRRAQSSSSSSIEPPMRAITMHYPSRASPNTVANACVHLSTVAIAIIFWWS